MLMRGQSLLASGRLGEARPCFENFLVIVVLLVLVLLVVLLLVLVVVLLLLLDLLLTLRCY